MFQPIVDGSGVTTADITADPYLRPLSDAAAADSVAAEVAALGPDSNPHSPAEGAVKLDQARRTGNA